MVGIVVAADRDTSARVGFLIPCDAIQRACREIAVAHEYRPYAALTDGLSSLSGGASVGVDQFLHEYLGTPAAPVPFGGRAAQLDQLDGWLASPNQPYALMVAEAGRGKSALLARWAFDVAERGDVDVAFVPVSLRFNTALKSTVTGILGSRLRHLHGVVADIPRDPDAWLSEIVTYLRDDRPDGRPLLIVLDGVDEATDWICGRDVRFPPQPGRGVKVLASARTLADCDLRGWMRRLEWDDQGTPIPIPPLGRSGVADVLTSMGDPLAVLGSRADVVGQLYRLSDGDPLVIRLYVEALLGEGQRTAFLTVDDLAGLKPGLGEYFERWWADQQVQWTVRGEDPLGEKEDVLDFFNLCAMSLGPLTRDEVAAIVGGRLGSGLRLRSIAASLGRFIIGDGIGQGYTFSHPRLGQFFREQMTQAERRELDRRFLEFGAGILDALTSGALDPHEAPRYALRYYGAHLERVGGSGDRFDALVSEGWLRAWEAQEGTYSGFLADVARAWRQADEDGAAAADAETRGRAIGRQCRYALIAASITSLVGNVPPSLLAAFVHHSLWTPIYGLTYSREVIDNSSAARRSAPWRDTCPGRSCWKRSMSPATLPRRPIGTRHSSVSRRRCWMRDLPTRR